MFEQCLQQLIVNQSDLASDHHDIKRPVDIFRLVLVVVLLFVS